MTIKLGEPCLEFLPNLLMFKAAISNAPKTVPIDIPETLQAVKKLGCSSFVAIYLLFGNLTKHSLFFIHWTVGPHYFRLPDFLSVRYNSLSCLVLCSRDLNSSRILPNVISLPRKDERKQWMKLVMAAQTYWLNPIYLGGSCHAKLRYFRRPTQSRLVTLWNAIVSR